MLRRVTPIKLAHTNILQPNIRIVGVQVASFTSLYQQRKRGRMHIIVEWFKNKKKHYSFHSHIAVSWSRSCWLEFYFVFSFLFFRSFSRWTQQSKTTPQNHRLVTWWPPHRTTHLSMSTSLWRLSSNRDLQYAMLNVCFHIAKSLQGVSSFFYFYLASLGPSQRNKRPWNRASLTQGDF